MGVGEASTSMQFLLGLVTLNRKWSELLGCSCSSRARQLQLVSAACCSHCQLLLVNAAVHLCVHAFAGRFLMYVFHKPICVEPGICYGILGYSKQTWERLLTTVSTFFQVVMGLFIITRYLVRLVHALIIIIFLNVFFCLSNMLNMRFSNWNAKKIRQMHLFVLSFVKMFYHRKK